MADRFGTDPNYRSVQSALMRKKLRKAGYSVDQKGPLTARLKSAWQDFNSPGDTTLRWNTKNARRPKGMAPPVRDPKKLFGQGNERYTKDAGAPPVRKAKPKPKRNRPRPLPRFGGGGGGGDPMMAEQDPGMFPGIPPVKAGNTNTGRLLGRGLAETMAGYQFDPQIQELQGQIARGGRDDAQHQSDIGGWYGQVRGAQATAGQRDAEAGQQAHTNVNSALQSILQSLGGSRGAGVVGAAGLNSLTGLAAQTASQDRYNADMAPLLASEEAGAHSREQAMASQRRSALDQAVVSAKGQRGQAKTKALADIIQANNAARQTNFQNRLAVQNARMAGASLGLNADQAYAGIEDAKVGRGLQRAQLRLQSRGQQEESGKPNWAKLNYPDRQTVVRDAVGQASATMAPDHWDNKYVQDRALKIILAGGYNAARGKNYRGKVNRQSQRQIQAAVQNAVAQAYQAWKAKQGG